MLKDKVKDSTVYKMLAETGSSKEAFLLASLLDAAPPLRQTVFRRKKSKSEMERAYERERKRRYRLIAG